MSGDGPIKGVYLGPEEAPYPYQGGQLLTNLLLFGRLCKGLGLAIDPERLITAARALEYVDLARRRDVYHTLRATLVSRQRDLALFDEAFGQFWRRPSEGYTTIDVRSMGEQRYKRKTQFLPPMGSEPEADERDNQGTLDPSLLAIVPTYSAQSALRHKDFALMSGEELEQAKAFLAQMPRSLGLRRTRRYRQGGGDILDPRRAFRQNMRYLGEPLAQPTRKRRYKPRPLVLLCDISGSMERYTRVLLHFVHLLAHYLYQVEAFVYSTELTYITHPIRHKSVDVALKEVGQRVRDWGGGTQTGAALRVFNYRWSRRVLGRGAFVLLISDGWDRGDDALLRAEMARLRRSCQRLLWLNPLLDAPDYQPLTRGAQAMLPFVDDFLPIRNLANLEMIVRALNAVHWERRGQRTP